MHRRWIDQRQVSSMDKPSKHRALATRVHHFVAGLRFDGEWQYLCRSNTGRSRWTTLPAAANSHKETDPAGVWWCVRCCAAVLGGLQWSSISIPPRQLLHPHSREVVQAMKACLIAWKMDVWTDATSIVQRLNAQILEQGGSALLQLQLIRHSDHKQQRRVCWAWIVGVEERKSSRWPLPATEQSVQRQVLRWLIVTVDWQAPWGCGYGAGLHLQSDGHCEIRSTDGQRVNAQCLAMITLKPLTAEHN